MEIFYRAARGACGVFSCTLMLASLVSVNSAQAKSWQISPFFQSLEDRGSAYDFRFLREGLQSVNKVKFKPGHTNQFRPFLNHIVLSDSMSDGAKRLKEFDEMSRIDLGTLAHESWHAFHENRIKQYSSLRPQKHWMQRRSENLFYRIPSNKALVALDEAYALFIGDIYISMRWVDWMLERAAENEELDCSALEERLSRSWELTWTHPIYGYYYRNDIDEFYIDQAKKVWSWLSGGSDDSPAGPDGEIYVDVSINDTDRDWVARNLFENKVTRDYLDSFGERLSDVGCN